MAAASACRQRALSGVASMNTRAAVADTVVPQVLDDDGAGDAPAVQVGCLGPDLCGIVGVRGERGRLV